MSVPEANNWYRFFMINGPVGDKRLDINFAWLRYIVAASHCDERNRPTFDEMILKFDYRDYFVKEEEGEQACRDFEYLMQRFGGDGKTGQEVAASTVLT
jgi:uncharacterized protein with von Willebrand factor type A (vWA) domain